MLKRASKIRPCDDLIAILGKKQSLGLLGKWLCVALEMLFG
jgi:hypothetical protein